MPNEDDMKAKDLIRNQQLSEAGEGPLPGKTPRRPGGKPLPSPHSFGHGDSAFGVGWENPEGEGAHPEGPGPGGPRMSMRPRGPFSPQETSMIKDLLLLAATEAFGNDFDGKIARKMMKGEVPDPGELQHIVDEVRRVPDLPESHQRLVQKLIDHINTAQSNEGGMPPA